MNFLLAPSNTRVKLRIIFDRASVSSTSRWIEADELPDGDDDSIPGSLHNLGLEHDSQPRTPSKRGGNMRLLHDDNLYLAEIWGCQNDPLMHSDLMPELSDKNF